MARSVLPADAVRPPTSLVSRALRALLLAGAALATSVPGRAIAATPDVAIRWSAPAGCPTGETVRKRVLALALAEKDVVLRAEVAVTERGGDYRAEMNVRVGPSVGKRVLVAGSCAALADSVGLVLAMSATAQPPPPAPLPAPPVPPPLPRAAVVDSPAPVRPVQETPPPSPPPPPRLARIRLAARGSADFGTLPAATVGAGLAATVRLGAGISVGVAGDVWVDQNGSAAGLAGEGAHFSLITGDLSGCYALPLRLPIELSPCAIVDLANATARGTGVTLPRSPSVLWVSLGVGAQARWELGRALALTLSVEGLVPTPEQSFSISGRVVSSIVASGRAHFGPEVRF